MKKFLAALVVFVSITTGYTQSASQQGIIEEKTFRAPSIEANEGGEDPVRRVSIYLPPGYKQSKERYPVIYFLHGFASDDKMMLEQNLPYHLIESNIDNIKKLTALKIDWGRNEEFSHIPATCLQFSKKLEAAGIVHFAEEYIGTHVNKLAGRDGRIFTEMLPFFDMYLKGK